MYSIAAIESFIFVQPFLIPNVPSCHHLIPLFIPHMMIHRCFRFRVCFFFWFSSRPRSVLSFFSIRKLCEFFTNLFLLLNFFQMSLQTKLLYYPTTPSTTTTPISTTYYHILLSMKPTEPYPYLVLENSTACRSATICKKQSLSQYYIPYIFSYIYL